MQRRVVELALVPRMIKEKAETIVILEEALELARAGELTEVALVGVTSSCSPYIATSGGEALRMLGAVGLLADQIRRELE